MHQHPNRWGAAAAVGGVPFEADRGVGGAAKTRRAAAVGAAAMDAAIAFETQFEGVANAVAKQGWSRDRAVAHAVQAVPLRCQARFHLQAAVAHNVARFDEIGTIGRDRISRTGWCEYEQR